MIRYHIMTEEEKELVSAWTYEGDYKIYNLPPYEEQKEKQIAFGNPARANNFYSYYDGDRIIGFTNISEKEKEASIGVGVYPELCGQGYGRQILLRAAGICEDLYPDKTLSLEVRTWNQRAIRCYESAGFRIVGAAFEQSTPIGNGMFYRMIKKWPDQICGGSHGVFKN